jgi:hypothetical protein
MQISNSSLTLIIKLELLFFLQLLLLRFRLLFFIEVNRLGLLLLFWILIFDSLRHSFIGQIMVNFRCHVLQVTRAGIRLNKVKVHGFLYCMKQLVIFHQEVRPTSHLFRRVFTKYFRCFGQNILWDPISWQS